MFLNNNGFNLVRLDPAFVTGLHDTARLRSNDLLFCHTCLTNGLRVGLTCLHIGRNLWATPRKKRQSSPAASCHDQAKRYPEHDAHLGRQLQILHLLDRHAAQTIANRDRVADRAHAGEHRDVPLEPLANAQRRLDLGVAER